MKARFILCLLMIFLAACSGTEPEETAVSSDAAAVDETDPTPENQTPSDEEAAEETAVAAPTQSPAQEESGIPAGETALPEIDPSQLATTIEEAAIVRDGDWVKGADDAQVVIIEYGDFQ